MKINTNQGAAGRQGVGISPNLIRNRVMVDIDGNEIDPRTKEIITKAEEEPKKE